MRKLTFIPSFCIKILALITMTFDHVGLYLNMQYPYDEQMMELVTIFRTIGRLALPLFAFMIVEGVLHTKNIKKYLLRLGIMASLVSIVFIVLEYTTFFTGFDEILRAGNIFLDLMFLAITIYLLKQPNWKLKLITLLPIGYSILSFVVKGLEHSEHMYIHWFPAFITMQYDFLTIFLGLAFYSSYLLLDLYIKHVLKVDKEVFIESGSYRFMANVLMMFLGSIVHFIYYSVYYFWPEAVFWDYNTQIFAILSGAFILFYNGKRGYNAKWFQYGSYLYYPLHILVIAVIYIIQNGGL